jgi:plastocyanin
MFRRSSIRECRHYAYALPQRAVGRLGLLLVVLLSGLLYSLVGSTVAGERLIAVMEVKLTESTIEMPTTVPPGQVTFSVTNASTMEHNFQVKGEGIEQKFDTNLKPGETRNLQIDLPAGTYTVYCSLDDHKERGMQLELRVAQQRSDRVMLPSEQVQLYDFTASLIF